MRGFVNHFGVSVADETPISELQRILMEKRGTRSLVDFDRVLSPIWEKIKKDNPENKEENTQPAISLLPELTSLLTNTRNLILHGAPGTGKTYLAKEIAKEMNAETAFVQFHPSYDYTDFVEGLRPKKNDGGEIGFERKDGVFKEFCKRALEDLIKQNEEAKSAPIEHDSENAKMPRVNGVDNFDESWKALINYIEENGEIKIPRENLSDLLVTLNSNKSLVVQPMNPMERPGDERIYPRDGFYKVYRGLQGAKYGDGYRKIILQHMEEKFGLKDYKPATTSTSDVNDVPHDEPLTEKEEPIQSIKSKSPEPKPFVFIIDEINRGELSKIFGELFYAIEPSYRGENGRIQTQYQNLVESGDVFSKGFFVPENVYIIGTMNDIDRSVDTMDFAFRRRFAFYEIKANDKLGMLNEVKDDAVRKTAIEKMRNLNIEISKIDGLSSSYHIGGAYFLKLKPNELNGDFEKLWKYHLEGLLREYLRGMEDAEDTLETLKKAYDNI